MAALFSTIANNMPMPFTTKAKAQAQAQATPCNNHSNNHNTNGSSTSATASPLPARLPAYPVASEWEERQQRRVGAPRGRIAHWDKKREKCQNCKHIYLKTLSRHAGFCSVDCKSNAAYIAKVNRTITAVRSVVEQQQQEQEQIDQEDALNAKQTRAEEQEQPTRQQGAAEEQTGVEIRGRAGSRCMSVGNARTFAEFGIEQRMQTEHNIEWAFSAIY